MRFLKKYEKKQPVPVAQTAANPASMAYPFAMLNQYAPLNNTEWKLYSCLREAVPIIDAAICKTVRLLGDFYIQCEDEDTENRLNSFLSQVQVNATSTGVQSFVSSYLEQLLTYGTAVGEIVPNVDQTGIYALYNAPLEGIELKVDTSPLNLEIYRKEEHGKSVPIKNKEFVLVSALNPTPGAVYGNSILKGLPFISKILLHIYNSIGLNWERVGNVRFAVTYKPSQDSSDRAFAKERAMQIAQEWSRTMHSGSGVNDFVAVGDVNIRVIGADNQILDSEVPVRQMLEQIVSKLSIPPFLLGLSWSTSERMSSQQADILTSELEAYRRLLNPVIMRICASWMNLTGNFSKFAVVWDNINLQDEVQLANARLLSAKALEIEKKLDERTSL